MKVHTEIALQPSQPRPRAPDHTGPWIVVGIAVVASLGLVPYLDGSMFADEGATLYSAHLSWSNLWAQSTHVDLVLWPYYVIVHGWVMVSGSIAWVRTLSLLAYFGTVVVVGWLGLRISGRWCGLCAAVLTATSALLVEKALNARPYEISTFLAALCAVALFRWLDDARARWIWLFSGLSLLVAAMQLFALLAPASMLACALLVRPQMIRARVRTLFVPLGILAAISLVWVVACAGELAQVNWIAIESLGSRLFEELRGPAIGEPYDLVLLAIVAAVIFKLASIWTREVRKAIRESISQERDTLAVLAGWAALPTVVLALASFAHPIYSVRYVAASAPGLALLASFVLVRTFPDTFGRTRTADRDPRRSPNPALQILAVVAVVLLVVGYVDAASGLQEDLESPAHYVADHARPGDALALPDHAITSAFAYYLGPRMHGVPLWPQLGVTQRYVEGFDLAFPSAAHAPHRIWLVDDGSVPGVTQFTEALHDRGYKLVGQKKFNGPVLFLYQAIAPVTDVFLPKDGATLQGSEVLGAAADSYVVPLSKVQFVLSGGSFPREVIGTAKPTLFGYYLTWNSMSVPNGTYSLQTVAINKLGRRGHSPVVTITVANPG